ncbi:MAG: pentapeptide repeat-containing protein [Nocardioidaceae bacterium]
MSAELITAYVGIATALGSAVWAVTRLIADRRQQREQEAKLAGEQLQQRQAEERRARQDRAAVLVQQLGQTTDPRARRWTMAALAMYPDDTLDLLLAALSDAEPEDAAAIKLAVSSIGPSAVPAVVRAHRIAAQIHRTSQATQSVGDADDTGGGRQSADTDGARRVIDSTRALVLALLFQLDDEQRSQVDLADVDLSRVILKGAKLSLTRFRKARLDGAVLVSASLRGASFRGASLDGAVLSRCNLRDADLTGASGTIRAVHADFTESRLDYAQLMRSTLDGAQLAGASLKRTRLDDASLPGATLTSTILDKTGLRRAKARRISAARVRANGADLSHAVVDGGTMRDAIFEDTRLVRLSAPRLDATGSTFVNCAAEGALLDQATLARCSFTGCRLSGASLAKAKLSGAVFTSCSFFSASLARANLRDARFLQCEFGNVDLTGVNLDGVVFEGCTFADGSQLVIDNDSWRTATLDASASEAFARASGE